MIDAIPGYDVPAVEAWVGDHVEKLTAPFTWTRLEGGHSNLTYRIDNVDSSFSAVIRRPPTGSLLPKAHDMAREWSCISALWDTAVPVAEPLAFCESPDVTGAHFYVMGLVDGKALYTIDDVERSIPPQRRMAMAESWIDVLAALHSYDPVELGLGDLGPTEGYVGRQCRTWYRSWVASTDAAQIDEPQIHAMHDRLIAHMPVQGAATLVHGDYGTHNVMIGADATVAAVVDWEIATLGDPMADFAYSINAWVEPTDRLMPDSDMAPLAPGFPDRQHLIDRYAAATGRDMSHLAYYRAFNRFKTACILHGVYARYRNGQKAIEPDDLEHLRQRVMLTIETAIASQHDIG